MHLRKYTFFSTSITRCGEMLSADGVSHNPERIEGLLAMRRPETRGELMQFLQAAICMNISAAEDDGGGGAVAGHTREGA